MFLGLFCIVGAYANSISAQTVGAFGQGCNNGKLTPIKCGYFEEGYQDGLKDSQKNRRSDYKRYRSKYERKYESYYRDGYRRGYRNTNTSTVNARWNDTQKNTYDQGYDDGKYDRSRRSSRLPSRYPNQDSRYQAYYRKGYNDGFDGRRKQHNSLVGNRQTPIGSRIPIRNVRRLGTTTGTLSWNGRVDNRVNIIMRGGTIRTETVSGRNLGQGTHNLNGVLPRRQASVTVNKLDGRGTAFVTQQPSRANNYTTIVQISDTKRGADNYRLQINWRASNALETYRAGNLTWRGRVDSTVNIVIDGENVDSSDESGSGLSGVSHNINGYLARRPGTIRVQKLRGRGTVRIIEQPTRQNGYVAVIRIFDAKGGADNYEINVTW